MAVIKVKDNNGKWASVPFSGGGDSLPKDGVSGQVLKKTDNGVAWDNANNHTHDVYSKSEVKCLINSAIGTAMNSSY